MERLLITAEDIESVGEVINFLIDNEQYGDDWGDAIKALQKIRQIYEEEIESDF